jgi:DNA-binding HxlR family transcriptional regulator
MSQVQSAPISESAVSRTVLAHVASRWSPAILRLLQTGERRYSQLRRALGGVSEKMLAQTLRELERDGLVLRTSYPVLPPHVVYELTGLGHACAGHVTALVGWLDANVPEFERARRSYELCGDLMQGTYAPHRPIEARRHISQYCGFHAAVLPPLTSMI